MLGTTRIAVGDLILAEVLRGIQDEREFQTVRKTLDSFEQVELVGRATALQAAKT